MRIAEISLEDDALLLEAFDLQTRVAREVKGSGWTPLPPQVRLRRWTDQPGWTFELVGAIIGHEMVGLGQRCSWVNEPDDHHVQVAVDLRHRRHGIGTALLAALENGAGPDARRFVSEPFLRDRGQVRTLADGFCGAAGYRLGGVEICLEATLSDRSIPPVEVPPGWRVCTHVDGIPAQLLPAVGAIQGRVDADAPSGDVDWSVHVVTPEEYQDDLARLRDEGAHLVEAVALAPDGQVAGWTALSTPVTTDRPATIIGTLVLERYRGYGLGMALKAAVGRRALELGVSRVTTESNEANVWMLDINHRQGFTPTGARAVFYKVASERPSTRS